MPPDPLGERIAEHRTSPVKVVILIAIAIALAALATWMWRLNRNIGEPVALVCVPATIYFLVWAYTTWVQRLDIRQRGVRLRFMTCRVDIPYSELAGFGPKMVMVNGTPQGANGIWFECVDGKKIVLPLSTNVEEACSQIEAVAAAASSK